MTTNIFGVNNDTYKQPKIDFAYGDKKPHAIGLKASVKEKENVILDISSEGIRALQGTNEDEDGKPEKNEGFDQSMLLMYEKQMEAAMEQGEAMSESVSEMGKILMVFQRLAHGDNVPQTDEQKLMEYDDKMYQVAKNLQRMAQQMNKNQKDYESLWDEDDGINWATFGNSDSFTSHGIEPAAAEPESTEVSETAEVVVAEVEIEA